MQQSLILYGTQGCHLCEDAADILQTLKLSYQSIDIIDDDGLLERFGTSIPVLQREASNAYLYWPFNATQVVQWLNQ